MKKDEPKDGDLQVWHIPQIPGKAFTVNVDTPKEAKNILNILAEYDLFQFENHIKPDYANIGGLSVYDAEEGEWVDWEDDEGHDIVSSERI